MTSAVEIGGYLELERFAGRPYHEGAIALNSGRSCLEYLVELRGIGAVWLPDWMCDAVYNVCKKNGVRVKVYSIGADMLPTYDFEVGEGEWLYLVDYYGQLARADVDEAIARSGRRLVVDEAQGFFREPWEGADTLYTCRKFFGVADGAYLYTRDGARLGRALERDESHARMGFVLGRYERPAGEFFAEASANNDAFDGVSMRAMSPITENLMRAVDYEGARRRREENWAFLHGRLAGANMLDLQMPDGPFMYPMLVRDAGDIRQRLAKAGIYVPMLWPNVTSELGNSAVAYQYSANILPLPVDQRYGSEDMAHMAETVAGTMRSLDDDNR